MNIHAVGVHTARPAEGDAQGGFQRSVLKPLLWGEPPAFGGVGGTLPPRLFLRGKRERGRSNLLAAAGICSRVTLDAALSRPTPATPYDHSKAGIPLFNSIVLWNY